MKYVSTIPNDTIEIVLAPTLCLHPLRQKHNGAKAFVNSYPVISRDILQRIGCDENVIVFAKFACIRCLKLLSDLHVWAHFLTFDLLYYTISHVFMKNDHDFEKENYVSFFFEFCYLLCDYENHTAVQVACVKYFQLEICMHCYPK